VHSERAGGHSDSMTYHPSPRCVSHIAKSARRRAAKELKGSYN
jgi:hypothetical protein